MPQFSERWNDAALAFALDLPGDGENFPKKVLALLDKHFGFHQSMFFPAASAFPHLPTRRGSGLSSYITYGLRYGAMYDY